MSGEGGFGIHFSDRFMLIEFAGIDLNDADALRRHAAELIDHCDTVLVAAEFIAELEDVHGVCDRDFTTRGGKIRNLISSARILAQLSSAAVLESFGIEDADRARRRSCAATPADGA